MKTGNASPLARRIWNWAGLVLACSLLSSCASLIGPREVEVPLHKLQSSLDRRFPIDNSLLELFEIHLSRPQLMLIPDRDRVALALSAEISPPFLKSYRGSIEFSGRPYIDAGRGAIYMAEPNVDRFALDGVDPFVQRQLTKITNFLLDNVIRDMPVYTFDPDDLKYAGVRFTPTRITTTRSGLVVTLQPVK